MSLLEQLSLVDKSDADSASEGDAVLEQDPEPDDKPPTRRKPGPKPGAKRAPPVRARSTATMAKEVAADLTTFGELIGAMVAGRDPVCGEVITAQARPVAAAVVAILERNPRMLAALAVAENAALFMQLLALGRALAPVVTAVYAHHGPAGRRPAPDGSGAFQPPADLDTFPAFSGVPRAHPA